jgi:molybdenum cofactor biosynthesis enzyme MoaA
MRERYKMLLTAPGWVPLCLLALALHWLRAPESHAAHWQELKDIIKWAWQN